MNTKSSILFLTKTGTYCEIYTGKHKLFHKGRTAIVAQPTMVPGIYRVKFHGCKGQYMVPKSDLYNFSPEFRNNG